MEIANIILFAPIQGHEFDDSYPSVRDVAEVKRKRSKNLEMAGMDLSNVVTGSFLLFSKITLLCTHSSISRCDWVLDFLALS